MFSIIVAIYLYHRNQNYDRWNAIFIISFAMIQLWEAGIWLNMEQGNHKTINSTLTYIILLTLLLQPIAQVGGAIGYGGNFNPLQKYSLWILLIIFIFIFIYYLFAKGTYQTTISQDGHLAWTRDGGDLMGTPKYIGYLYLIGLFLPLVYVGGWPLITIGLLTFTYSWMTKSPQAFGSYWCLTAIIYSMVALFV